MSEIVLVDVTESGELRFLATDGAAPLAELGTATRRRASRVEPVNWWLRVAFRLIRRRVADDSRLAAFTRRWRCRWRADLALSGGPVLGPFGERADAIAAEVEWLSARGF